MDTPTRFDQLARAAINEAVDRRRAAGQRLNDIAQEMGVTRTTLLKYRKGELAGTLRAMGSLLVLLSQAPADPSQSVEREAA